MIYVFEQGNVVYDGSTLTAEQKAQAVAVEVLPESQTPSGHFAVLKADVTAGTVYYEYKEDAEVVKLQKLLDDATALLMESEVL